MHVIMTCMERLSCTVPIPWRTPCASDIDYGADGPTCTTMDVEKKRIIDRINCELVFKRILTMWSTSLSVFDRELSLLSSAVQKYALRCDFQKMTHVSLELAYSGHDRSVYDYMSVIMITDKFPMGVEFLHNQQHVLRSWRRLSKQQRHDEIT